MPVFKSFYIVDAFTSTLFGGNPAGVVLLNGYEFPEKELMIKIAQELRYSETAFVVQHSPKEFSIRFLHHVLKLMYVDTPQSRLFIYCIS